MSTLRASVCKKLGLSATASQTDVYRAALKKIALAAAEPTPDQVRRAYQAGMERRKGGKGPGADMPERTAQRDLYQSGLADPSGAHWKLVDAYAKGWNEADRY